MQTQLDNRIGASAKKLEDFCLKWRVEELSLFGSILGDDFRTDSDIDVLIRFAPEEKWTLFDLTRMQAELMTILGRNVDLVDVRGLKNPFRRKQILATKKVVYAA